MLDALLASLGGLVRILRREVLGAIAQAGLEPVEERLVGRPLARARSISSSPAW